MNIFSKILSFRKQKPVFKPMLRKKKKKKEDKLLTKLNRTQTMQLADEDLKQLL